MDYGLCILYTIGTVSLTHTHPYSALPDHITCGMFSSCQSYSASGSCRVEGRLCNVLLRLNSKIWYSTFVCVIFCVWYYHMFMSACTACVCLSQCMVCLEYYMELWTYCQIEVSQIHLSIVAHVQCVRERVWLYGVRGCVCVSVCV